MGDLLHIETLDEECLRLYRQARVQFLGGARGEAERLYRQIRRDHSCELYYEIDLPRHTRLVHPIGTVLGRAVYADYFVAYQGVSVGSTVDGDRPTFTGPCVMFPHSAVIGPVTVGKNVWITAGTIIEAFPGYPQNIPDDMLVYHRSDRTFGFRHTTRSVRDHFFKVPHAETRQEDQN